MARRKLTAKQRRRQRKKGRGIIPYVTCEGCGWTGYDVEDPLEEFVTACRKCGCEYARCAVPLP